MSPRGEEPAQPASEPTTLPRITGRAVAPIVTSAHGSPLYQRTNEGGPDASVLFGTAPLPASSAFQANAVSFPSTSAGTVTHILWQNTNGSRGFWPMNGTAYTGGWDGLGTVPTAWEIAGLGDFTGDGKPDIVWQNTSTGMRGVWPMNGTTYTGAWGEIGQVPVEWDIAAVADFNRDGKTDILWQNRTTGMRGIWLMNGTAFTGQWYPFGGVPLEWNIAGAADFDADNKTDILWENTNTGSRGVWPLNDTNYMGGWIGIGIVPVVWRIAAVGDFTGDGKADLLWQNNTTGLRGIWPLNNGVHTGGWHELGIVPLAWSIAAVLLPAAQTCPGVSLDLNLALGGTMRVLTSATDLPRCFNFDQTRNAGQQYLLLFENMPRLGGYGSALFPGTQDASTLSVTITAGAVSPSVALRMRVAEPAPRVAAHSWDFGGGPIYEFVPEQPEGGAPPTRLLRRSGELVDIAQAESSVVVGDTIVVFMSGLPRLSIPAGDQRAVVRMMTDHLIIAEDVRLATLTRSNGGTNTPMDTADMRAIANAYAAQPRVQADLLFSSRYNNQTETTNAGRVIAVHTVMDDSNTWGYTYSNTNTFMWDYWVGTNGTTKGLAQHALRNAHNLFMHEIAHQRHWGWLERAGRTNTRGNRWLVEGFAAFTERLPIASYLLNSADPSRIGNVVLPYFTEFNGSYYFDDVPNYRSAGSSMFGGYSGSSYAFDYLADQVARAGGNWRTAIANFVTQAGVEADLNTVVNANLGITFGEMFTRARIALYTDDYTVGLPNWTQYHQFQLRGNRTASPNSDPRNAWTRIVPGNSFGETRNIASGGAFGYLIDGVSATSGRITVTPTAAPNGVMSITRVK